MTTPSDAATPAEGRERRLHPWSWLFVLVTQLKQFALPLLVLLFTGRGDRNELVPLVGVGVLALVSVAQYFTYRYRIGAEGLSIRSGLFQRTVRHIPFTRLHDVSLQQSLLHRLFGVAEVRLESAGGARPEATMRVLALHEAQALEQLVRRHARELAGTEADPAAAAPPLLVLGAGEIVRQGLISNRGMLLVAAAAGAIAQMDSRIFGEAAREAGRRVLGWGEQLHLGGAGMAGAVVALVVAAVVLLRLFSIAIAFLHYHGYRLRADGERLHVQRGLLTRHRGSVPRERIQAFDIEEGVLHRWLGRRGMTVDTLAAQNDAEGKGGSLRHLVPIATPATLDAIVARLLPRVAWPPAAWTPLPARTWVRRFLPGALFWGALAAAAAWRFGAAGAVLLLGVPWAAYAARRWVEHAGYSVGGGLVVVREGWLDRHWRFAEVPKVQAVRLSQGPLDRRCGTASLLLDTAGASPGSAPVRLRYLPLADARALQQALSRAISGEVTRARTAATAAPAP
jgi:putative membrane protein